MAVALAPCGQLSYRVNDIMKEFKSNRVKSTLRSRRAFLGSLVAGVGFTRVLPTLYASSSSPELQAPPAPTNVRLLDGGTSTVGATVLTAKDLTYKGCFALPGDPGVVNGITQHTGFSYGAITLRRASGALHLLTTGDETWNGSPPDQVYEVIVPSTLSPDGATAITNGNRASLVRWWGDVYQGKRWYQNGATNPSFLAGVQWDETNQGIWLAYNDGYGIGTNDPSLIFTKLNSDGSVQAYGPWRATVGSHFAGGYMTMLPSVFANRADLVGTPIAGKRLVLGSQFTSGGAGSPWGITSFPVTTEPTPATPPDPLASTQASVPVFTLARFDINHLQPVPTNLGPRILCNSLLYYPAGTQPDPGAPYETPLPVLGPVGTVSGPSGAVNDHITSVTWVNSASGKQGVIYAACLADGITATAHAWYGNNECIHGQIDPWHQATGEGSNFARMGLFIYDQNDFAKVAKGTMSPTDLRETSYNRIKDLTTNLDQTIVDEHWGSLRLAFDPVDSRLYVANAKEDRTGTSGPKAIIHVFQVA
jgi:hypothetical protein